MVKPNREYKNSLFKDLFHDETTALELYNALTGGNFTLRDGLRFTTLENALFMDRLNDISFTIGDRLVVLVEHQSTVNENMPLRALMYIGRVYEKIIDNRAIYRSKLFTLPVTEFYVLYNGAEDYPDAKTLRLSDAFMRENLSGATRVENIQSMLPSLELAVRVFNINKGHNDKILGRSEILRGYATFIRQVRDSQNEGRKLEDAILSAIDFCVARGILVGYLESKSSEVRNMIFTEFNLEDAKEIWFEEGMEKGIEKGMEKGMEKGKLEISRAMLAEGDSIEKIARITKIPLEILEANLFIQ